MTDKASYRNRGGLAQKAVTWLKVRGRFLAGPGTVIKHNAEFHMCKGAELFIGRNCTIQNYAFFQLTMPNPSVSIGDNCVIGRHCMITAKSRMLIGNDVLMGAFVQVIDHNHSFEAGTPIREQKAIIKEVRIGNDVWIGAGAKILAGVTIGDGCVIGSNSVVTTDIPAGSIAIGSPAKVARKRGPPLNCDETSFTQAMNNLEYTGLAP